MACKGLLITPAFKSLALTVAVAPVTSAFLCTPYPTTTTSCRALVSSESVILNVPGPLKASSWLVYPMKENIKVPGVSGTFKVNVPSGAVVVPVVVPFTSTVTPGKASPVSVTTLPVIGQVTVVRFLSSGFKSGKARQGPLNTANIKSRQLLRYQ